MEAPAGHHLIRIGQFWSLEDSVGQQGHILKILGIYINGLINIRKWVPLIPTTTRLPEILLFIDDETEIRNGYILRFLESVEVQAPQTSSPSHPSETDSFELSLDQNNPLPT